MSMIDELWLWHRRMGHLKFENFMKVAKKVAVRDLPKFVKPLKSVCKHCQHGKQTKSRFKAKENTTLHPWEIVHIDLCGPKRNKSMQGEYYFMSFIGYYTRITWVTFLK